jgi:hypothetical protein
MSLPRTIPPLPQGATMAIWPLAALDAADGPDAGPPLYRNDGKWLHPLFDLLELDGPAREALVSAGELFLRDRVIGRAAAFLILRARIRHAWADVVSDGALALFDAAGASLGGAERVTAIGCQTEELLRNVADSEAAWDLLCARRKAALERPRG